MPDIRPPPRLRSVWQKKDVAQSYAVVAEIDALEGTEQRYLIRMELFTEGHELIGEHWCADVDFWLLYRRHWDRYDMLREDEILDDVDD